MIHKLIEVLLHNQNQFASGGLLLMAIGAIGASLRKLPSMLWYWILRQTTLKLVITDDSEGFQWFKAWTEAQMFGKKMRRVDLSTPFINNERVVQFSLAPGAHWVWQNRRCYRIEFRRNEEKVGGYKNRTESFVVQTFGRNQSALRSLIQEMRSAHTQQYARKSCIYYWTSGAWRASTWEPRGLETVILPAGVKEEVKQDMENFYASRKWYKEMGIPFHRGYLLHGPAGTGKTALVTGLCASLNTNVYFLKLNELSDSTLSEAIADVSPNSLVLLEDVDCVAPLPRGTTATKPEEGEPTPANEIAVRYGVSLAGLLNVLDGLQAPQGVLFFLTTNFPAKLDPALLRPGRIDFKLELGHATKEQKLELFKRFFPTDPVDHDLVVNHGVRTMAEFQELLIQRRNEGRVCRPSL